MTKRLKVIFSVLASKSRLEILKILAAKGDMSYTELKEASGFTPKRESGKFAYHLKKLVQQNLVIQNKQERKYQIAPLGRLVLSLAKQIEEESLVSSGRLYVRESSQRIEEFDTSKIIQSLIKEANVPLELAQNIASEAESRILKFQLTYLTSPLIREIVNSILLEQGLEQYWKRLSRLGMPVYDLELLIDETSKKELGFEEAIYKAAQRIFSDYLTRTDIPADLVDAHFNGEIHMPFVEYWVFRPDVVSFDFELLEQSNMSNGISESFLNLVHGLAREANSEVFIKINKNVIDEFGKNPFFVLHNVLPSAERSPRVTLHIKDPTQDLLERYRDYVIKVKEPKVLLSLDREDFAKSVPRLLINKDLKTSNGFKLSEDKYLEIGLISLSINLPYFANEAQGEESYFKVKVLLLKDIIQEAIAERIKLITNNLLTGLLPNLKKLSFKHPSEYITPVINLTGLKESMIILNVNSEEVIKKESEIIDLLNEKFGYPLAWIEDDSGERLANIGQKAGKRKNATPYSLGIEISGPEQEKIAEARELNKRLKGGLKVVSNAVLNERFTYLYKEKEVVCKKCGWTNPISLKNCRNCGYPLEYELVKY